LRRHDVTVLGLANGKSDVVPERKVSPILRRERESRGLSPTLRGSPYSTVTVAYGNEAKWILCYSMYGLRTRQLQVPSFNSSKINNLDSQNINTIPEFDALSNGAEIVSKSLQEM
jgi:hypothetical protein